MPAEKPPLPQDNREFTDDRTFKNKQHFEYSPQKTVNIRNVVEDFKKTLAAIDATDEINEEVKTYLKLVDTQSLKEKPSPKLIKANLTNAAGILDEYITETLNKPSRVVTDWISALLLQNIDYKTDKNIEISAENKKAEIPSQLTLAEEKQSLSKEDKQLRKLYKTAQKLVDSGSFRQALMNYEQILPQAQKSSDKIVETRIYLDKAYIYDMGKNFPKALENYSKAAMLAFVNGNNKIQATCHYNMASIYDDSSKTDLALKHYYAALSFNGQVENLKAQSHTLNDVGNVFAALNKRKKAINHYQVGLALTKETHDIKGRAFLLSNTASVFKAAGKDDKALNFYKKSIQCDIKTGNLEGYLVNYEKAADIMSENNFGKKAEIMYKKSLTAAQKLGDKGLFDRILKKLDQNTLSY